MFAAARHLLLLAALALCSCTSTTLPDGTRVRGGPSGSLMGVLTGGILGHLGDRYISESTGDGNGSSSGGLFSGGNGGTGGTGGTGSGNAPAPLLSRVTSSRSGVDEDGFTVSSTSEKNEYASNGNTPFERHKGLITGAVAGLAAGAVTDAFRKGESERMYNAGYSKAKSDSIKEFYWLKRSAQKGSTSNSGSEETPVQHRYYEVEVPAHTTSDGVLIEKHKRIIEVVE
jgi:hypothetical protein